MNKSKLILSSLVVGTITIGSCVPAMAYTKEETVYTKLNPDGSESVTIVSEHLKNDDDENTLKDLSTLSDIYNVNGDEKFTQDGENISWESQGNDIYYQGKTDQQLPITMKVTYKLNGKTSTVDDMLGKKGTVEIHIEYTNHVKEKVDGESLYVPFVAMTGTTLPTDTNSKVKVTNGKVSSNGSNYIVVAMATPGLSENYDNNKDLKELEEVTIQYETKSFELNSLITVATPSLLSESDMDVFDKMDEGYSLVDQLSSAYQQLKSGGDELNQGMNQFAAKYSQFNDGVNTLDSQSQLLVNGVEKIGNGVSQLDAGLTQLSKGLQQLSQNSEQLRQGASQLSQQILATVNEQLQKAGLNMTVTEDDYEQKLNAQISGLQKQKETYQTDLNKLNVLPDEQKQAYAQQIQQLNVGIATIEAAIPQLEGAKSTLDSIFTFKNGINAYTTGVDQASQSMTQIQDGSSQLLTGSQDLLKGVNKLLDGTGQLASNSQLLNDAAQQLSAGSDKLASGLKEFDESGLSKINSFVNGEIKTNVNKTKKLITLANDYQTFTKTADGVESSTKFIMIINSKKK